MIPQNFISEKPDGLFMEKPEAGVAN